MTLCFGQCKVEKMLTVAFSENFFGVTNPSQI